MLRRDGLRKFAARAGSAGLIASLLAASAAGGSLPTGGMLLPKPKGPSRNDLPSSTAINVFRIPSAAAYGISDVNKSFSGRDFSKIANADPPRRAAPRQAAPERAVHQPAVSEQAVFQQAVAQQAAPLAEATPVQIRPQIHPRVTHQVVVSEFSPLERADEPQLQPNPFDASQVVEPATFTDLRPAEAKRTPNEEEARIFAGLRGICPVTLIEERRVITPRSDLFTIANGCRFEFATPDAKAQFDAEPEKYIPVLCGRDIVLTGTGQSDAVGSLKHAGIYRGRLFLFQTAETCRAFYLNPQQFASAN